MTYDDKTDEYVFSSGRRIYSNLGLLSLWSADNRIYEGYDGTFAYTDELTKDEHIEVAEYMVKVWQMEVERAKAR